LITGPASVPGAGAALSFHQEPDQEGHAKKKLAKTYPYPIPPFQLDASEEFSQPNPLCMNIFFLGEALCE